MSSLGRVSSTFSPIRVGNREMDPASLLLLVFGLVCVAVPLELGQLTFAFVGAVAYALVQSIRSSTKEKVKQTKGVAQRGKLQGESDMDRQDRRALREGGHPGGQGTWAYDRARPDRPDKRERDRKKEPKVDYRQPSAQPVMAPTFVADAFDAQVNELLRQIAPSPQGEQVMKELAAAAREILQKMIPEAEVVAFASADIMRGTAFGVAVPEVDIICNATPSVLAKCLQSRTARPIPHAAQLDARKLHKSALRACTDELVAGGVFKFRRSAFKGLEPKVTLLASGFGAGGTSIPIDFSVNTLTPLYNAALLTECGQIDIRARDLILLVRRWAKDRGVSHAAKGHLSPYAWTLLAIYFLQVSKIEGDPILPMLKAFKLSSGLLPGQQAANPSPGSSTAPPAARNASDASLASLFKGFVHFYAKTMDWRREAVSVHAGKRQAPSQKLPLHIVELSNGSTEVAPSIEDPFKPAFNLSALMTAVSVVRFKEELARADALCSSNASLSEILEPWVPPERGSTTNEGDGESPPES